MVIHKKEYRSTKIFVNDILTETIELEGNEDDRYKVKIIPIPKSETAKQNLNVMVNALNDKITIQLIEIRLLSTDEIWSTKLSL